MEFFAWQMRLFLPFLNSPGFPAKATEQWVLSQAQWSKVLPKWGEDRGLTWTHDVDDWRSVSQPLVAEFPGAPEIKAILLATNVIKNQWQQKEGSEKTKAIEIS